MAPPDPTSVLVAGIRRPALTGLLAARGLVAVADPGRARLALVACPSLAPALPSVIEARGAAEAAALLDSGAADVVLRDDPDALVAARVAALARTGRQEGARWLRIGDIAVDTVERRVLRGSRTVALLPREYALLLLLARAEGSAVPREALRRGLSGTASAPETNLVAVHVSRLRVRLGAGEAAIVTERGAGYRLVADAGVCG